MSEPKNWTPDQLTEDVEVAKAIFRQQRLDEPLALYTEFFEIFAPIFGRLIDELPGISSDPVDSDAMAALVRDGDVRTAFRYLAAPPISEDDLKTLAETTLSATALRTDPGQAKRVRDTVLHILDPHRFAWIEEGRDPTSEERDKAVVASAALVAAQKVSTYRRSDAKQVQEDAVKALLRDMGFSEVPPRDIPMLQQAPDRAEFCGESKLGDARADLVIRLCDDRVLALECKASNSAVNSVKRVNREAAGKARAWIDGFGRRQIVPGAVISGVFNPANLQTAQTEGLSLFWSHRLDDLQDFIEGTGS